jgi:hypothetical protein
MSKFEPAPLGVYIDWLRQHLNAETRPTHWYDYPYPQRKFLLATADFTTGGECGVNARSILIPAGIRHLGGALGHNLLYHFDKDALVPSIIPIYSNLEFLVLPGVAEFIVEAKQRDRAFWAEQEKLRADSDAAMLEGDLGRYLLSESGVRTERRFTA